MKVAGGKWGGAGWIRAHKHFCHLSGGLGNKLSGESGGRKNVRDSNENVPDPHAFLAW